MRIIKPLLISTTLLISLSATSSFASDDKYEEGEKLFKSICAACHGVAVGGMDMNKRIAPPIAGVRKHYIDAYPDEASFVSAVSAWVQKQDESKSLMRGAIRKFKIMPPLKVSEEDAKKIAAYIYAGNIEKPEGFEQHIQQMHGKPQNKGMAKHKMMPSMNHENNSQSPMTQMMSKMKNKAIQEKRGIKAMMQQLNLSPEQKQKMQALIQEKNAIMQPLKQEMQQIKREIHQLDTSSPDYKNQIFSLAEKKSKLVFRMVIEKGEKRMQVESVLSPQQRAKFKEIRQKRFEKKQKH